MTHCHSDCSTVGLEYDFGLTSSSQVLAFTEYSRKEEHDPHTELMLFQFFRISIIRQQVTS